MTGLLMRSFTDITWQNFAAAGEICILKTANLRNAGVAVMMNYYF